MPDPTAWPSDGSIQFFEKVNWETTNVPYSMTPFGKLWAMPSLSPFFKLVAPVFCIRSRAWVDDATPPDFDDIDTEVVSPLSWPGPILAQQAIDHFEDPEIPDVVHNTQSKWRIAWKVPPIDGDWFRTVHLRWKLATFYGVGSLYDGDTPRTPDGLDDLREKWWQHGLSDLPGGYDPKDMSTWTPEDYDPVDEDTWPGTDWEEVSVPSAAGVDGLLATTYWWPLWPWPWALDAQYGFTHGASREHGVQGLTPGGSNTYGDREHPIIRGTTLA